jgi:curved DNA-binding protein CbpA
VPKFVDYYAILGVPHRAHLRVVEEAYWEQAHELQKHPTRKAQRRLGQINEAYEVLGTPYRRARYDAQWAGQSSAAGVKQRGPAAGFLQTFLGFFARPFRPG